MLQLSPPVFAALFGSGGSHIGLVIAIVGMIFGGIMAIVGMYFAHQRQRLWHETARLALEKGQPIPPASAGVVVALARGMSWDVFTSGLNDVQRSLATLAIVTADPFVVLAVVVMMLSLLYVFTRREPGRFGR